MSTVVTKFEIFENGDPYSRAWDCCESSDDGLTWFYRGDISGRFCKRELVSYLRRQNPGCDIVNRYGRKVS